MSKFSWALSATYLSNHIPLPVKQPLQTTNKTSK